MVDCAEGSQQDSLAPVDFMFTNNRNFEMVDVVRLDEVVHEHVDFIKIDTQGHDDRVLMGAKGLIEKYGIDVIHMEYAPALNRQSGGTPSQILHWLYDYGYVCFDCAMFEPPVLTANRSFDAYPDTFGRMQFMGGEHGHWTDIMCFH
jgi:hypothetical protein